MTSRDRFTFLLALAAWLFVPRLQAMDWSQPWTEPRSAADAAQHSDEYAWRVFVAVNGPAARDPGAASSAVSTTGPTVWEQWASANDIFRPDGKDPGEWQGGAGPLSTAAGELHGAHHAATAAGAAPASVPITSSRFEAFSARDLPNLQRVQNGRMVAVTDPLSTATRLTEIHMNRAGYDYIRARELYNTQGQLRAVNNGGVAFPPGTKEIKAKWRLISAAERGRYRTLTVTLADGTQRLYGLTALHVVTKDLPTWFWATFEHVDNQQLPGNDGWQVPSKDSFACAGTDAACNRAPRGIGLEGTVWQNYRLRGTLTTFVDAAQRPELLANSELEAGMQQTSSCITCHSRAGIGGTPSEPIRLPIFDTSVAGLPGKRGFVGVPREEWFAQGQIQPLDFVWSLAKARPQLP